MTGNIVGDVTGNITGDISGNVVGNITGVAARVASGANIHVGVITATSYSGDGSSLAGIAATNYNTQTVTANSAETIIDLSNGNMITMNQSADTTVGFASTSTSMSVTLIRIKDTNNTARSITWPSSVKWNNETAPTLIEKSIAGDRQQFQFITRDAGLTWYAWEEMKLDAKKYKMFLIGRNNPGGFGLNDKAMRSSPTQVMDGQIIFNVGMDQPNSPGICAFLTDAGTLFASGPNSYGMMGSNNTTQYSSPIQIGNVGDWSTSGQYVDSTALWVKSNGDLMTWGNWQYGWQSNNNPSNNVSSPIQVAGGQGGMKYATNEGATLETWQQKVACSSSTWMAINEDGELWGGGSFAYGRLGQNQNLPANANLSSPVQVPGTTWRSISGSNACGAGVKNDDSLWVWGRNGFGDLGQNQANTGTGNDYSKSSPVRIPGSWKFSAFAPAGGFGLKTDGTLWSWGYNSRGQIGINTASNPGNPGLNQTRYSSPIQIPGVYTDCCGGGNWKAAIKSDGTCWAWGQNYYGQLGQNERTDFSSPVQIPGTWSACFAAGNGALGLLAE